MDGCGCKDIDMRMHWCPRATVLASIPSLGYDLFFGTSLAKVDCLGAENNCVKHTDR